MTDMTKTDMTNLVAHVDNAADTLDTVDSSPVTSSNATPSLTPVVETSPRNALEPFQHSKFITANPAATRDDLTRSQSGRSAAAHMSGEHIGRLLYSGDVDAHLSPYGVAATPNSLDSAATLHPRQPQTPARDRQG